MTAGLEYSRYVSAFNYRLSGEKTQIARYIGIPVRLDWTLASGRWLDLYLGGGLKGDFCVGATLGGKQLQKDGLNLSLLGAGGLQLNMTDRLGLYVEPVLNYTVYSGNRILETYRTVRPFYFSVSTGFHISF